MYRIYRNLTKNNWTVQHKVPGKGWRKLRSADVLWAPEARFVVYAAGRERVLRERRKNVHAYAVVNEIVYADECPNPKENFKISYNPYEAPNFTAQLNGYVAKLLSRAMDGVQFTEHGAIYAPSISHGAQAVRSLGGATVIAS